MKIFNHHFETPEDVCSFLGLSPIGERYVLPKIGETSWAFTTGGFQRVTVGASSKILWLYDETYPINTVINGVQFGSVHLLDALTMEGEQKVIARSEEDGDVTYTCLGDKSPVRINATSVDGNHGQVILVLVNGQVWGACDSPDHCLLLQEVMEYAFRQESGTDQPDQHPYW